jgi:Pentapeptide repeats (9 copies)
MKSVDEAEPEGSGDVSGPDRFECAVDFQARHACREEPFYREHGGKRFCILHCPIDDKGEAFAAAVGRVLDRQEWNFNSVWFPDAIESFQHRKVQTGVDFRRAIFRKDVDFTDTKFESEVHFDGARFCEVAKFDGARFAAVYFNGVKFANDASFRGAQFASDVGFYEVTTEGELDLSHANFGKEGLVTFRNPSIKHLVFRDATLAGKIEFSGKGHNIPLVTNLHFWNANIATPESVTFKTCQLRPEWLVTVDPAHFRFLDVHWDITPVLKALEVGHFHEMGTPGPDTLSAVYRALAANAEEHQRFDEASRFRYAALDALRLRAIAAAAEEYRRSDKASRFRYAALRLRRPRGWGIWDVHWWYWALSGYGERAGRALAVLLTIWVVFAGLYTLPRVGFQRWEVRPTSEKEAVEAQPDSRGTPLRFRRALTYSLEVMSFQKPLPAPASPAAHILVVLEAILGPLQGALFALAVRRKVSR